MNTKLIISSVAVTTVIFTIVFVFQIQPELEFKIAEEDCKSKMKSIQNITDSFERINEVVESDPTSNSIKKLDGYDNISFVSCTLLTFKADYERDRVGNSDLKYLLEAEEKLHKSNSLPIVSTYADSTMEAIQLGLSPEIFDIMTETQIADIIREIVDVTVYVFSEEPFDPKLG